jgi:uncharacterized protein (TIGR03435 family)
MTRFLLWMAVGACAAVAQTPKFEVASIKPSDPNGQFMNTRTNPNGGITYEGITLKVLIMNAWGVLPFQITGGPAWAETERYEVEAKPEKPVQLEERRLMLQELLRDRFHLVIRKETREMSVYRLVLARKDGGLGARIKESACLPYDREHPPAPGTRTCGSGMSGGGKMDFTGAEIPNMAANLSTMLERTVVDQTGLKGNYDFKLNWSPDQADGGPSIFTALEEQLGLKLVAGKGPVEMIVIEKAEKPTEN